MQRNDLDAISALAESLRSMIMIPHSAEPSAASTAADDLGADPVFSDSFAVSSLQMEYAAEHVAAISRLLVDLPLLQFPIYNCVRSMLEACAVSAWLTDSKVDAIERCRRAYAARLKAFDEYRKCGNSLATMVPDRTDHIKESAAKSGVTGALSMLGATDMIKTILAPEFEPIYRMLSGLAHGQHWAIRQLGFEPEGIETGSIFFGKSANAKLLATMSCSSAKAFAIAWTSRSKYFGHDPGVMDQLFLEVQRATNDILSTEAK